MRASMATGLALCVFGCTAISAAELDMSRVSSLSATAQAASEGASDDYLNGEPEKALARLRRIEKKGDAEAAFVLGNMTWTLHPAESFAWHRQALDWGGDSAAVQLELALHYTRQENCTEALAAWRRVDELAELAGYFPAVAAYCHLKLGQDREAFAMFDRTKFGHAGKFEGLLEEIWGERPTIASHADALAAFKRGQSKDSNELLEYASALTGYDGQRARALTAILAVDSALAKSDPALQDLGCLRPWIADDLRRGEAYRKREESYDYPNEEDRKADRQGRAVVLAKALRDCGLMLEQGRLPASDGLVRVLLADIIQFEIASARDMLDRHGPGLKLRAESIAGDLEALALLAALQLRAVDRAGLAESDRYGWERYRDVRFAASRVAGLIGDSAEARASAAEESRRAWKEFPDNAYVLKLVLQLGELKGEERKRALRSQVLAEFHGPTEESALHASKSARALVRALIEYRKLVNPEWSRSEG